MAQHNDRRALTLRDILQARSVAVIGASEDLSKWGGRAFSILCKHQVSTAIYPVNPNADTVMGVTAYRSIADCPTPIDIAMVLVPASAMAQTVQACAQASVGCAIIITAGFAEASEAGQELEQQLLQVARESGMRIIGPNCIGILNAHRNMLACTAVALPVIDRVPVGHIGFASQSGALMGSMLARGVDIGAGFSSLLSLGNQCDLDLNDCFEYFITDPQTRVICLYVEALRNPSRFRALLAQAHASGKPVVVCKSGRSAAGERAVQSHTASMAGAYESFAAICRSHGVYLFHNVCDMLDAAMIIERGSALGANHIAVFSGSGGAGALLVDALDQAGFRNPELSDRTIEELARVLPAANLQSPIDFGTLKQLKTPHPMGQNAVEVSLAITMADPGVSGALVMLTSQPNMGEVASAVARVGKRSTKPLLYVHIAGSVGDQARQTLRSEGYGFVESQNDALAILKGLRQQREMPVNTQNNSPMETGNALGTGQLEQLCLTEPQARDLLAQVAINMSPWVFAATADDAVNAMASLNGTCVAKGVSPTLVHKSDAGAVRLHLATPDDMRLACHDIAANLTALGHSLEGFLITPMLAADAELILGLQRDPAFGSFVLLGAGGTLVELLHDVQMVPVPVSEAQAHAMINGLRSRALLEGWRSAKPADLDQLAAMVVALSDLAMKHPDLLELDINPLMLVDGQFVGVDARATLLQKANDTAA